MKIFVEVKAEGVVEAYHCAVLRQGTKAVHVDGRVFGDPKIIGFYLASKKPIPSNPHKGLRMGGFFRVDTRTAEAQISDHLSGKSCGKCARSPKLKLHPCPYKSEINDDNTTLCECCESCRRECADDV